MAQKISKLTFQINITNSLELENKIFSPVFSTSNNVFWKLCLKLVDEENYGLYIVPVACPDEINWRNRSKLSIKLYAKEISSQTHNLYTGNAFQAPPDTKITSSFGCSDAFEKSSLRNGTLLIGVTFENIVDEVINKSNNNIFPFKSLPENLIQAWKTHLHNSQPADVEFNVQGEKFYAYSSILTKRSEYFANVLSGHWAESTSTYQNPSDCDVNIVQIDEDKHNSDDENLVVRSDNDLSEQVKHRIKITDYTPNIFAVMLEYLYTNQIKWVDNDDESIAVGLFCIADRYLLLDLRERAKIRIFDELNISNASEIMFGLVPKYEDLKEPVLEFMVKNFEQVSNTQGFKNILTNSSNYPGFEEVMSELLSEYFKIQKSG